MARSEAAGWTRTDTAQSKTVVIARKVRLYPLTEIVLDGSGGRDSAASQRPPRTAPLASPRQPEHRLGRRLLPPRSQDDLSRRSHDPRA